MSIYVLPIYYDSSEAIYMIYIRLKELREDRDYKQKDIAKVLSVRQNTYSDYENGKINVPIEVFIKLAVFYNTSIDYLVGLTDNLDEK